MTRTNCGFEGEPDVLALVGPTVAARIGFDPAYVPGSGGRPDLPPRNFPALVDTGAMESCIDAALAAELDLPIVDRTTVAGAHGAGEVNRHLAQIYVPGLRWTVWGAFSAVHLAAGGQQHMALIGRTFLRNFRLTYEGRTGHVTIDND